MAIVSVNPDGHEWLVTQSEIVISIAQLDGMQAIEIGERILSLIPRIKQIAPYVHEWSMDSSLRSLSQVELYIQSIEVERSKRTMMRKKSLQIRAELQKNYDHIFISIGRRDGFCCAICGGASSLEIDHVVAVINGGNNDIVNLQLLCKSCNCKKGDK